MKTFTNATAKEIENGVISYTFNTEAETESAVIECIEKGIRFNTTGRRSLVIYQPAPAAETYAVCWGVEYSEEDGESNAIAETANETGAKELAENESKENKCRMCVVRKSDNKVIVIYDSTTPETSNTMNTETTNASMIDAITNELNARNDKSAWDKAVTTCALELVESLDGWDKQPASVAELREMMLNGADNILLLLK